jgi:uncharacterized coiled-coil protein SlyX
MTGINHPQAEARIEALEFRLAHLEDTVLKLSTELATQQQLLDRQVARYRQLLDHVTADGTGASAAGFEIPPHY